MAVWPLPKPRRKIKRIIPRNLKVVKSKLYKRKSPVKEDSREKFYANRRYCRLIA